MVSTAARPTTNAITSLPAVASCGWHLKTRSANSQGAQPRPLCVLPQNNIVFSNTQLSKEGGIALKHRVLLIDDQLDRTAWLQKHLRDVEVTSENGV